jgi:RND family efflux transporter MFP subunit
MAKKLRAKYLLIFLPLLALAGFTGYRVKQAMQAKAELQQTAGQGNRGGPGGGGGGPRAQNVQTGVVASGRVSEKITLTGSLKAKEQVDVSPKIPGRILKLNVDVGQPVSRGALLAVIEDDEIQQQLERSKAAIAVVDASIAQREAELNNAKADLERRRKLVTDGLLPATELDALETRQRVAQSQLELARAQRRQSEAEQRELSIRQSQTRIYAPISGVVARRHLDLGALATSNTPIVTLVSLNPMVIEAKTSERDIARIKRGATVTVTVDSVPGQTFSGRVMRILPQLDPQTRNGLVEIEIANRGGVLKGEMFARAELDLGSQRETTLLPRDALVYRGEQPGVYTIEAEKAKFLPVETGLTQEDKVEAVSGLKVGDVVITRGSNLLKEGDRVRVMGGQPGGRSGGSPEGRGGQPSNQNAATQQPGAQPPPAPTQSAAPQAGGRPTRRSEQ